MILLSYFCLLSVCGVAIALPPYEFEEAERMERLGLFADMNSRATFNCPAMTPSPTVPTSVHALRPADIKHVAAMGDSLTAANGAKAFSVIAILVEYRGVSWSIGGDANLKTVITLPNILRQLNSKLDGYSLGTGNRNTTNAGFNVAKAGGVSSEMPDQANLLVERMIRALGPGKFATDWKLVTFFIGGNDLCSSCKAPERFTAAVFADNIKRTLDILHARMPRTIVNYVTVLNVAELEDLHDGIRCTSMQNLECTCGVDKKHREFIRKLNLEYQAATNALIDSGIYDTRDDFTVVRQTFMEHMKVPSKPDGSVDFSYFSPDCFHFSQKGHETAAIELWNNMLQKVGEKSTFWDMQDTIKCPSTGNGYIYTSKNSV